MATVKAHLADWHQRSADSCSAQADTSDALAECCKSAGRGQEALHHQAHAQTFRKLAGYHAEHAKNMKADAADEDLSKLATSGKDELNKLVRDAVAREVEEVLGKKIQPDRYTSVMPSDTPFGIRAVPRQGQPDIGAIDKSRINPVFRGLVENLADEV